MVQWRAWASQEQAAMLSKRLLALERRNPPAGVEANYAEPSQPRPSRKRRAVSQARWRELPTSTVTDAVSAYRACGTALRGGDVAGHRRAIGLPPVTETITERAKLARRCPARRHTHTPTVELSAEALS